MSPQRKRTKKASPKGGQKSSQNGNQKHSGKSASPAGSGNQRASSGGSKRAAGDWQKRDPDLKMEAGKHRNPVPSRQLIHDELGQAGQPLTKEGLARRLGLADSEMEGFQRRLGAMLRDGELVENRRGGLAPTARLDLITGTVIGHRDGFGFLQPEQGGDDIFLSPRQMRELLHGDRAVVRISGVDRRGRSEGSVVDVLERANTHFVGRYIVEHGVGMVVPDNKRIAQDLLIPSDGKGDAKHGQVVLAEIVQQPSKRSAPIGRITEVVGDHLAPGMEIEVAIRSHGIPHEWPAAVRKEAKVFGAEIPASSLEGRKDLRDLPLVTIDGADARDFDDAVFSEPVEDADGGWRLWVAIADVASYVTPGSALNEEAAKRGTSVYFPQQVIPMLPEELSNGLCSLNPKVDRLCMVCEMRISKSGKVLGAKFHNAVMRSKARLTYDAVAAVLEGTRPESVGMDLEIVPHLRHLSELYSALAKARRRRGAIDFESDEVRIVFSDDRKIDRVEPVIRNRAHKMIEECMIAANVQAARFLRKQKLPLLYRVHEPPKEEKIEELRQLLAERGLSLGGGDEPQAGDYAELLTKLEGRPDSQLVQAVLLRSLKQAVYAPDNAGHFGLALGEYAHFTSPIRRYPDLLVHRAIKHALSGGQADTFPYQRREMEQFGHHCSMTERRADEATRDAVDWLKCYYLRDKIGEEFDATVTGVHNFGLFVELDQVRANGLIHVTQLDNDYYHHDPAKHALVGERSGSIHRLADKMRVKLLRVDLDERKIDFEPVAGPDKGADTGAKPADKGKSEKKGKRRSRNKSRQKKG